MQQEAEHASTVPPSTAQEETQVQPMEEASTEPSQGANALSQHQNSDSDSSSDGTFKYCLSSHVQNVIFLEVQLSQLRRNVGYWRYLIILVLLFKI